MATYVPPFPSPTNIYGWDLVCADDLTPDMQECGGIAVLANALYRRASTPRGRLIYDRDYGFWLEGYVNEDINTASDIAPIAAGLDAEFRKDPRVRKSTTVATFDAGTLTTTTTVYPVNGPSFKLVLGVGALYAQGLTILSVSPS